MSKGYFLAEYVGKDKKVKLGKRGVKRGNVAIRRHLFRRKFSVTPCHGMRFKEEASERIYYRSYLDLISDWNLIQPVDADVFRKGEDSDDN